MSAKIRNAASAQGQTEINSSVGNPKINKGQKAMTSKDKSPTAANGTGMKLEQLKVIVANQFREINDLNSQFLDEEARSINLRQEIAKIKGTSPPQNTASTGNQVRTNLKIPQGATVDLLDGMHKLHFKKMAETQERLQQVRSQNEALEKELQQARNAIKSKSPINAKQSSKQAQNSNSEKTDSQPRSRQTSAQPQKNTPNTNSKGTQNESSKVNPVKESIQNPSSSSPANGSKGNTPDNQLKEHPKSVKSNKQKESNQQKQDALNSQPPSAQKEVKETQASVQKNKNQEKAVNHSRQGSAQKNISQENQNKNHSRQLSAQKDQSSWAERNGSEQIQQPHIQQTGGQLSLQKGSGHPTSVDAKNQSNKSETSQSRQNSARKVNEMCSEAQPSRQVEQTSTQNQSQKGSSLQQMQPQQKQLQPQPLQSQIDDLKNSLKQKKSNENANVRQLDSVNQKQQIVNQPISNTKQKKSEGEHKKQNSGSSHPTSAQDKTQNVSVMQSKAQSKQLPNSQQKNGLNIQQQPTNINSKAVEQNLVDVNGFKTTELFRSFMQETTPNIVSKGSGQKKSVNNVKSKQSSPYQNISAQEVHAYDENKITKKKELMKKEKVAQVANTEHQRNSLKSLKTRQTRAAFRKNTTDVDVIYPALASLFEETQVQQAGSSGVKSGNQQTKNVLQRPESPSQRQKQQSSQNSEKNQPVQQIQQQSKQSQSQKSDQSKISQVEKQSNVSQVYSQSPQQLKEKENTTKSPQSKQQSNVQTRDKAYLQNQAASNPSNLKDHNAKLNSFKQRLEEIDRQKRQAHGNQNTVPEFKGSGWSKAECSIQESKLLDELFGFLRSWQPSQHSTQTGQTLKNMDKVGKCKPVLSEAKQKEQAARRQELADRMSNNPNAKKTRQLRVAFRRQLVDVDLIYPALSSLYPEITFQQNQVNEKSQSLQQSKQVPASQHSKNTSTLEKTKQKNNGIANQTNEQLQKQTTQSLQKSQNLTGQQIVSNYQSRPELQKKPLVTKNEQTNPVQQQSSDVWMDYFETPIAPTQQQKQHIQQSTEKQSKLEAKQNTSATSQKKILNDTVLKSTETSKNKKQENSNQNIPALPEKYVIAENQAKSQGIANSPKKGKAKNAKAK